MTDLFALAARLGFSAAYALLPEPARRPEVNRLNARVCDEPRVLMPDARAALVLLRGYAPFDRAAEGGRGGALSAYYAASHAAYLACREMARALENEGWRALPGAQVAVKPLLIAGGLGRAGRNSLVSVPGLGTRFHAQVLLTNAPISARAVQTPWRLDDACAGCGLCRAACPTGAIGEGGRVDIDKCLRAYDDGQVMPEALRPFAQNRLLGCEACQAVCPRNDARARAAMPPELDALLGLERLLRGEVRGLEGYIGKNYARRARLRMKAALAAGNLLRADCLPALRALARDGAPGEIAHALWAIERIEGGKTT